MKFPYFKNKNPQSKIDYGLSSTSARTVLGIAKAIFGIAGHHYILPQAKVIIAKPKGRVASVTFGIANASATNADSPAPLAEIRVTLANATFVNADVPAAFADDPGPQARRPRHLPFCARTV